MIEILFTKLIARVFYNEGYIDLTHNFFYSIKVRFMILNIIHTDIEMKFSLLLGFNYVHSVFQLWEPWVRIGQKNLRAVKFNCSAIVHKQNVITFRYCLNSMSNCHNSSVFEFFIYEFLNLQFRLWVNFSSGFIKNYNFVSSQSCSTNTKKLALTRAQFAPSPTF